MLNSKPVVDKAGSRPPAQDIEEKEPLPSQSRPRSNAQVSVAMDQEEQKIRGDRELEYVLSKKNASSIGEKVEEFKQSLSYIPVMLRDPRQFVNAGYKLSLKGIKLFVVITMYNEGPDELILTLRGICENIRIMMKKLGAPELWKEIAVCIVADGRAKVHKDTLDFLESIGLYSQRKVDKVMEKKKGQEHKVGVHLFESTAVFVDHPDLETNFPPLQLVLAMKEHNGGKIDSHWWFFEGFCKFVNPAYTFLIDVGTKPRRKAFFHIYRAFERNTQIGGACGQITTRNVANFNPVVAAQHFEYKIANILDKAMESICGFISVLPGAFSAYRYEAVAGEPLRKYFHHIEHQSDTMSPFEANMYLAEDRILCFEIFARKDQSWTLHYIKDSVAETDVPTTLTDLMKQRRRWINGSFFAMLYALGGFWRVWAETQHSFLRKFTASIEFLFYLLNVVVNWFLIGTFYLTMYYAARYIFTDDIIAFITLMVLVAIILIQFFCGLTDKPINYSSVYWLSSLTLAILYMFVSVLIVIKLFNNLEFASNWKLLVSIGVNFGIYFIAALLYREFMSVLLSFSQYWAMIPTFTVVFPVFSMCNVHDISWGTKNIDSALFNNQQNESNLSALEQERKKKELEDKKRQVEKYFSAFRMYLVMMWVVSNAVPVAALTLLSNQFSPTTVLFVVFCVVAVINGIRLLGSMMYWVSLMITRAEEMDQNRLEKQYFKEMRDLFFEKGGNLDMYKDKSKCWRFWTVPFQPRTWVSISNTLFLSGFIGVSAAVWCLITGLASIPLLLLFPVGPLIICGFALSWRLLARMEFEMNSKDGQVARILGIDSASEARTSLRCPPVNVKYEEGKYFLWMRDLLTDSFTYSALTYFLVPKLIVFGFSWLITIFMFALSLFLTFSGVMASSCTSASETLICLFYNDITEPSWGNMEWLKWIINGEKAWLVSVPIGLLLFLLSCHLVNWLDWKSRTLASKMLGEEIISLEAKRRMILVSRGYADKEDLKKTAKQEGAKQRSSIQPANEA